MLATPLLQRRKLRPEEVEWLVQSPQLGRGRVGIGPLLTSRSAPQLLHPALCPGGWPVGTASVGALTLHLVPCRAPTAYGRQRGERVQGSYSPDTRCGVAMIWLQPSTEAAALLRWPPPLRPALVPSSGPIRSSSRLDCCYWSRLLHPLLHPALTFENNLFIKCSSNGPSQVCCLPPAGTLPDP